jgi:hypothetical protein
VKRLGLATAALAAAVAILVALTLPPAPRVLPPAPPDGTVAGVLHVHTTRSDGGGTPDEVAAAAARAGLRFVVFTDHGDGTRTPDPPRYRSGVLCLDGVEVSTTGGHYLAIGLPGAAPYPLGGEPRDVVEDVRRLGGFGIVAHPDSPRADLRWTAWDAPFDGIEVLNLDTAWRARVRRPGLAARLRLAATLLDYPVRPAASIAQMLPGPSAIDRWEATARERRIVLTAGTDAHGRLTLGGGDPTGAGIGLPLPGYGAAFRVMSVHVLPDRPFTGDAPQDAAVLLRSLRAGHLYVAIDGVATPPSFTLTASNALGMVHEGDTLGFGGAVTVHVRSNAPPGFTTIVWNGSREITRRQGTDLTVVGDDGPALYWVEIRADDRAAPVPWLISNPVFVRGPEGPAPPPPAGPTASDPLDAGGGIGIWRIEHDPSSQAAIDADTDGAGPALRMQYRLGDGSQPSPFAALVRDLPRGPGEDDRLTFAARADRPMRVSVQLRSRDASRRWQRSVYVDTFVQDYTVPFADMRPVGDASTVPDRATLGGVLFVIDTTNTKPGTVGRLWIARPALAR